MNRTRLIEEISIFENCFLGRCSRPERSSYVDLIREYHNSGIPEWSVHKTLKQLRKKIQDREKPGPDNKPIKYYFNLLQQVKCSTSELEMLGKVTDEFATSRKDNVAVRSYKRKLNKLLARIARRRKLSN